MADYKLFRTKNSEVSLSEWSNEILLALVAANKYCHAEGDGCCESRHVCFEYRRFPTATADGSGNVYYSMRVRVVTI